MLVSAKEMLDKAKAGKYAVGHFNINNLEWTKAILLTAQENNSPVILGVSEGAGKYMGGISTVVGMVNGMLKELNITVPVALHLDHGTYEGAKECIEKGFSSVMFDGSKYGIEENIEKTKEIVALAHANHVSAISGVAIRMICAGKSLMPSMVLSATSLHPSNATEMVATARRKSVLWMNERNRFIDMPPKYLR